MHTPTVKRKRRTRTAYSRKGRPISGTPLFYDQPVVKELGRDLTHGQGLFRQHGGAFRRDLGKAARDRVTP